jgi:hypothetical protein
MPPPPPKIQSKENKKKPGSVELKQGALNLKKVKSGEKQKQVELNKKPESAELKQAALKLKKVTKNSVDKLKKLDPLQQAVLNFRKKLQEDQESQTMESSW